ncbi:protein-L-isoaspartate(D-aspartate) O-methyltransferase [Christiangramia crocea]|uniref:Protein-L-isoaspartate O-methyltransferase n=1 Tax=Christiangramia crocea TaxID=2904124 RepID=A0A9X1UZG5_9FLAO|nr:protein-L-isoaspartate(D-aspartate) O-methyltransferase [Gramella crocea]MCG9973145.1 protein-L-isoaspartate(D-aspartate) O-methyltransferase [Gramella crocea]
MYTTIEEMIENQLKARGIKDPRVLDAMRKVDRSLFIPDDVKPHTYDDGPLPIGGGQTISQPYIVAYMAKTLKITSENNILEIGTGCGYNAAVLAQLAKQVYSIEIIEWLVETAKKNLKKAGVENVSIKQGDGYKGWPEKAPFDAIMLTAAPPFIPFPLKQQLKVGGRLLAPVGMSNQRLILIERTGEKEFRQEDLILVSFVPMKGEAEK